MNHQPVLKSMTDISSSLYDELLFNGDAISLDDVKQSIIKHMQILAGWQVLTHRQEPLDDDVMIEYGEWALLYPVVRTHLDYVQAKRMEGSRAISGEAFGKDVNTAYQDYKYELDELPKKSFCEKPFYL